MLALVTNDDGIQAPGLEALVGALRDVAVRVIVVAPRDPHSGCGHRVTTDRPLRIEPAGRDRYSVDGTPADCVRLALATLLRGPGDPDGDRPRVDWVFSGINAGGNLGVDIHHSGTVAAAREGALHGVPALAASQYHRREEPIDWGRAAGWLSESLAALLPVRLEAGEFWNVNLPHPLGAGPAAPRPALVECRIDPSPLPLGYAGDDAGWHYRSRYHERARVPDGDVAACFGGSISVSRGRVV
jgi:5'-nucleotidase